MTHRSIPLAALALALAAAPAAWAQPTDPEIAALMAGAQTDFEAGRFADAEEKAERAWAQKRTVDIAVTLAEIELKLGKWPEAAEHMLYAKKTLNVSSPDALRERVETLYEQARRGAAAVVVKPSVPGCTVRVEGTPGERPVTTDPLFVAPGKLTITVTKEGYLPETTTLTVVAGDQSDIAITLRVDPNAAKPGDGEKPIWPYFLLGGIAAAGLGVGVGLTVVSVGKQSEADDLSCAGNTACAAEGDALLSDANTFFGGGMAGFGVAGGALLGLIVYAVVPGPADPAQAGLAPWVGPGTAGLSWQSRF